MSYQKWFKENPHALTDDKGNPVEVFIEEGLPVKYHEDFVTNCIEMITSEDSPVKAKEYYKGKLEYYISDYTLRKELL